MLVVFVLPGFVALRYAEQTYLTRAEDSALERVLSALYFSLLTYVVIAAAAVLVLGVDARDVRELWRGEKALRAYLALSTAAIGVPLVIAELARRWNASRLRGWVLRRAAISPAHKTASGWEHFFLQGRWAYVRATLKDGRVVAGFFGPDSFAVYTAETPDLYLERRYQLNDDDWFAGPAQGTLGVYVRAEEIVSVEFYDAGAPPPRPSWWRRMRSKIKRDAGQPHIAASSEPAADSQAGRDLPRGSGAADPTASPSGPE